MMLKTLSFKRALCIVTSMLISMTLAQGEDPVAALKPVQTSSIENQKMIVKGQSNQMRMAISTIAGKMARELNQLLKEPEGYSGDRPIYIEMFEKGRADKNLGVRPRVTPFGDNTLVIDLLVDTRSQIDRGVLSHGIVDVLLYRRGLEGVNQLKGDQQPHVPAWLSHGLIGAMAWNKDSTHRRVYEHLLVKPELFPLEKIFSISPADVRELDSTDLELFRAVSTSMVLAMLRLENGEEAMRSFVSEVVLFEGEIDVMLRKHFPSVGVGSNGIQKTWSLQLAEMAAPKLTEVFTLAETDRQLKEILYLTQPDDSGNSQLVSIDNYQQLAENTVKERVLATEGMRRGLIQLSNRCHPLYRPLLVEYIALSSDISAGKFQRVAARLPEIQELRLQFVAQDERCRDYLDWYQISRAHEVTGDFSGYRKLKELLDVEREERKDDVIDPYLDRIQELMGR